MRPILPLMAAVVLVVTLAGPLPRCLAGAEVRGVSLAHLHRRGFGYGTEECRKQLSAIKATGANWVAINDYAYMEAVDRPAVRYGRDPSPQAIEQAVRDARELGLKVLLKPHIWSREFWGEGKWHGDIRMSSEQDWDEWFAQYSAYVLMNAQIGQRTGAEALCVGVEYQGTSAQSQRWRALVAKVREVYSGHLTYAATFMEWKQIDWWDALDCIGIDAYWPVAQSDLADEAEIRRHWAAIYDELLPAAQRLGKPVCFLEIGYSPSIHAGREPWSYSVIEPNEQYQARLYRVALEEAGRRDAVVGVFIWKWFTSDQFRRMEGRDPFAMQDRPLVLEALREQWAGGQTPNQKPE